MTSVTRSSRRSPRLVAPSRNPPSCSAWAERRCGGSSGSTDSRRRAEKSRGVRKLRDETAARRGRAGSSTRGRRCARSGWGEHLDVERKRPLVSRVERADTDDMPGELLTLLVLHGDEDRVLPRLTVVGVLDRALDFERRKSRDRACRGPGVESKILLARRTDARAFEDPRPAMRARPRRARRRLPNGAHEARP